MAVKMNDKDNNQIPIQALELLPWYALGLLDSQEMQFVEDALLEYPELQDHLKTEHEMALYLREEKELFSLSAIEDREKRLKTLLEREEFQPTVSIEQESVSISTRFSDFFRSLFSGDMSKPQYMGVAAVTTLSVALLLAFAVPLLEHKSTFYPAAVETEDVVDKNTLLIGLNVKPNDPRLLKILSHYNIKITTIAGKDGMYRLSFTKNKPNAEDLKKLLSTLSTHTDLVWFVGEAY